MIVRPGWMRACTVANLGHGSAPAGSDGPARRRRRPGTLGAVEVTASAGTAEPEIDLGAHYARVRERLCALLEEAGEAAADVAVPACPGWTVRDVVAHLVGNIEDGAAGRIQGPPSEAQTAEQVARHRDESLAVLADTWRQGSPLMEDALRRAQMWPGMIDALSHEHDVRAALDRPGARSVDTVRVVADRLVESAPVPLRVRFPDGREVCSAATSPTADAPVLRTTPFEVVRLRLGRRSRDQVAALRWEPPPGTALDRLFVFGPSARPLVEPGPEA